LKHFASSRFWATYDAPPAEAKALANKNFILLKADPRHPSLHFKKIGNFWFVRVGIHHRALGTDVEGGVVWFWMGSHADYDKLIN
jgi:hypothetical protein